MDKRLLFQLLFAIYVASTTVFGYNPGTSWRNMYAFAALKEDGTVAAWGDAEYGGSVPQGLELSGVKTIYSTQRAFAAQTEDGTVAAWGDSRHGGNGVPVGLSGVKTIYSTQTAFAALKEDGTVAAWGLSCCGGGGVPERLSSVKTIYSTGCAFAALKEDGTVAAWGYPECGGSGVPGGLRGLMTISSADEAFAVVKEDGTVVAWGHPAYGGVAPKSLSGVKTIFSSRKAFATLMKDGTVQAWGHGAYGGNGVRLSGVKTIYSAERAFAALKEDGTVTAWGDSRYGGSGVPEGLSDVKTIYSTQTAFAALKEDGTVAAWGDSGYGGNVSEGLSSVKTVYATAGAFAALKEDATVVTWGDSGYGGNVPEGLSSIDIIYGTTKYVGLSVYPHSYRLWDDTAPSSMPTSQPSVPTSLPSTQPTTQPSTQPTSLPTTQPTMLPTSQPTSVPTSSPTIGLSNAMTYEGGLSLDTSYFLEGHGVIYANDYSFIQVGRMYETYYLSIFVWDTGFGPVSSGQYLRFQINGERVEVPVNGTMEDLFCAPVTKVGESCNRKDEYAPCAYNIPISRDHLRSENGGTVNIIAESQGVVSSACPYDDSVIYVKYVLSGPNQDTPSPTLHPTFQPTKGATNVVNGLELNVNKLNIWQLLQISIGVGVALGAGAVYLCKLREKSDKVYKHPMPFAVVCLGMLGMELTSMVFLIVNMFKYGYGSSGGALLGFRFIEMCIGGVLLFGTFRTPSSGPLRAVLDFGKYLDEDHFVSESRVYFGVAFLCLIDLTFVVFLPWKDSKFALLSKGFPNINILRTVQVSLILTAVISFCIQLSYLVSTPFSVKRDLMFVLNIILLGIKVILIMLEFGYKNSKLAEASTSLDKVGGQGGDVELGSTNTANQDQIVYHHNPMIEESHAEDTIPLLQRVDNVEHRTESIEVETMSVKAKTESIEAKTERMEEKIRVQGQALEEMNKKMEKMANAGNTL